MSQHAPFWLGLVLSDECGVARDYPLKCVRYPSGEVDWELRLLFAAMLPHRKKVQAWDLLKKERVMWSKTFTELKLDLGAELKASRAAANRSAALGESTNSDKQRQEFMLSTVGVLCVFLGWALSRHTASDRARARDILIGIAEQLARPALDSLAWFHALVDEAHALCSQGAGADGRCQHIAQLQSVFDALVQDLVAQALARTMRDIDHRIVADRLLCDATRSLRAALLSKVSGFFDQAVATLERSDPLDETTPKLGCMNTRPRIDEDLKRVVTTSCVQERRVASEAAWARATKRVSASSTRSWEHTVMKDGVTVLSLVEDASRIGDPAEDAMVYLAWSGNTTPACTCQYRQIGVGAGPWFAALGEVLGSGLGAVSPALCFEGLAPERGAAANSAQYWCYALQPGCRCRSREAKVSMAETSYGAQCYLVLARCAPL